MVTFTVNDAAGYYNLGDSPSVTNIVTQIVPSGETGYFLTGSTIYNASMFAVQEGHKDWLGTLFFGRTTIGADGKFGFLPDAQVDGMIGGVTADKFAVRYVTNHGSSEGLQVALFAGDDTLIGNSRGGTMAGEAGNDLITAYGSFSLDGGSGDDVIRGFGGGNVSGGAGHDVIQVSLGSNISGGGGDDVILALSGSNYIDGGAGDDVIHSFGYGSVAGGRGDDFVFMSDASLQALGGSGVNTFFYNSVPDGTSGSDTISDFTRVDYIQLDPAAFTALADGFTQANFVIGSEARDADDFIIFYYGYLYYDPDGNGAQQQVLLGNVNPTRHFTWENIVVSGAVPDTGDLGAATPPAQHDAHAWALHAGIHATGLLP